MQDIFQQKFSTLLRTARRVSGGGSGTLVGKFWKSVTRQSIRATKSWRNVHGKRSVCCFFFFRRPANASKVSKEDLSRRFNLFAHGTWEILLDEAVATLPVQVKPRSGPLSAEQRGHMASQKVLLGEITRARQCPTGTPLAPDFDDTLNELQRKRPQEVVRELPEHVRSFVPETPLVVNNEIILKSLKSSPRGSSPGPGGCTYENLKVLMDDVDTFELLCEVVTSLAQARVPASMSKRNRHRLLTSTLDCQNSVEASRQGFRVRMCPVPARVVQESGH